MTRTGYSILGWLVWQIGSRVAKRKVARNRVRLGAAGIAAAAVIAGVVFAARAASGDDDE
jgi:hypothetical protein